MAKKSTRNAAFTVPGLSTEQGHAVAEILQQRLHALNDLQLTLKHAHWNVVGPNFIAVHEMLDPQIDEVRGYVDELAERMATMGVSPSGLPGSIVAERTWDDYSVNRAPGVEHLAALDLVYDGVISDHREALARVSDVDPITEDMLIGQVRGLELFQWFMRSHIESGSGVLEHTGARTEKDAAKAVKSTAKAAKTSSKASKSSARASRKK